MSKKILSIIFAVLMVLPMILTSCSDERTDEEIMNDITNSGITALTLSVWVPTNATNIVDDKNNDDDFASRLQAVEDGLNEILMDKNYSTKIDLIAIPENEYNEKLNEYLKQASQNVIRNDGNERLPSDISKDYKNTAVKNELGSFDLVYPSIIKDTQIDIFYIGNYNDYASHIENNDLYALDSYLAAQGGAYRDLNTMISQEVLSKYKYSYTYYDKSSGKETTKEAVFAIPNNHLYASEYQYILVNKELFDSYVNYESSKIEEGIAEIIDITEIRNILDCEAFIKYVGVSKPENVVPFVGSLKDLPNFVSLDGSNLFGSEFTVKEDGSIALSAPTDIFSSKTYQSYVKLYKLLSESSYVQSNIEEGKTAAVQIMYGTNEDIEDLKNDYYVIESSKPVANSDRIFDSMFAVSRYSINYDRAMKVLYLLQTNREAITLLQYGVEGYDYTLEENDDEEIVIKVNSDSAYDMTGFNLGNSYFTYIDDGATIDEWSDIKKTNYDMVVFEQFLHVMDKFQSSATDEEIAAFESKKEAAVAYAETIYEALEAMNSEEVDTFFNDYSAVAKNKANIKDREEKLKNPNLSNIVKDRYLKEIDTFTTEISEITDRNEFVKSVFENESFYSMLSDYSDIYQEYR